MIEEAKRRGAVHEPAGDPHHQPGKLLVGRRIETDARHAHRRIGGVPGADGQRHQRAERAFDQRGQEQAGGREQDSRRAAGSSIAAQKSSERR